MDRLTERYNDDDLNPKYNCGGRCRVESCEECDILPVLINRLGQYEDLGLSPDEIHKKLFALACADEFLKDAKKGLDELMEYRKAKAEGRLVVLPLKAGDKVYFTVEGTIEKITPKQE